MVVLRCLNRIKRNAVIIILLAIIIIGNAFFITNMADQRDRDQDELLAEVVAQMAREKEQGPGREAEIARLMKALENADETELQKNLTLRMKKLREQSGSRNNKYISAWRTAENSISRKGLYGDNEDVDVILRALAHAPILKVDVFGDDNSYSTGTSHKWLLTLDGGQLAIFKLMWDEKGAQKPNGSCNSGFEMPSAEIAAFQLHRLFGLYNTPYVSGRKVDIATEILPAATDAVKEQIRRVGETEFCITGKCFLCKKPQQLCLKSGKVEGAIIYWIPKALQLNTLPPDYHPFATTNMKHWKDNLPNDNTYCSDIPKKFPFYKEKKKYLDIFDFALLDFIMHHFDSKHYTIDHGDPDASDLTVRLDFGRAFCYYDDDRDEILLAPLRQCCTLRRSTWGRLMLLQNEKIPKQMLRYLRWDPLHPVLKDQFYTAMVRRLRKVATVINDCARAKGGLNKVLVNDY